MNSKNRPLLIIIVALAFCVVVLGLQLSSSMQKVSKLNDENAQVNYLLSIPRGARGYTCGVLTDKKAEQLLLTENLVKSFRQGASEKVQEYQQKQPKLFWSDYCKYQDYSNSTKYVEFYVSTFQSDDLAEKAFPDFIQIVNDSTEIDAESYGQRLVFDGGVYYLLNGNRVYQVAGNNGAVKDSQDFSLSVFNELLSDIE